MCDICVMNSVKDRMLSRRSFFKAGAMTVAAGALATTGTQAMADGHSSVEDMTHTVHEDFPTYFGEQQFFKEQVFKFEKDGFNLFKLEVNEHTGTHVDAPLHFSKDGNSVDEIPVANLIAPLCVIDIRARAAGDADTQLTPDDIKAWMSKHGDIPAGACIAMNSGWSDKVATAGFRNADDAGKQHYPGFHPEASLMLIEDGNAMSMAADTLSLDHGISGDFATHYSWLPSGRFGIENIANLDNVPASGATLIVGAPKHRGGSGGPARIFAMI